MKGPIPQFLRVVINLVISMTGSYFKIIGTSTSTPISFAGYTRYIVGLKLEFVFTATADSSSFLGHHGLKR